MNKPKTHMISINMYVSDDYTSCRCECKTTITGQKVLGALLASAVVAIAHDHSCVPHKFAEATCATIMEFIDKPGFIKPKEQLS